MPVQDAKFVMNSKIKGVFILIVPLSMDIWLLLDSSRFPLSIQALALVSLHIPRASPRDMQGYSG